MTDSSPSHKLSPLIDRRRFMVLAASGLTTLATGCQSVNAGPAPSRTATAIPHLDPTPPPTLTAHDWSNLAQQVKGEVVRADNANYATALQLFNPRFDAIKPDGIAYCTSPEDVQACLAFSQRFQLPFTVRSGGHSYAGYSTTTGLVIDMTRINAISVDTQAGTATIGGGARLIDVYAALTKQGVILPAGSCPTVGIAGLTSGGGVGVLGRKFGLTCDNLLSAQVVLADGRTVTCDKDHDPDLFWALRGGGGGNFGVVTSFTFSTHPLSSVTLFTLGWSWNKAVDVFDAWQQWAPQAPDELWSNCLLLANQQNGPLVRVNGVYVGDEATTNAQLQQLIDRIGSAPTSRYVWQSEVLDAMLYEAGCSNKSLAECRLPSMDPQGQLQREIDLAKADYFAQTLPRQAIQALVDAITTRQQISGFTGGGIGIDAYGGAINQVARNATAFVHRNALFSAQYTATWNPGDADDLVTANRSWLNNLWQAMRPYATGTSYQNYIDPDLKDWQQAYYGENLSHLRQVKKTYDPGNLFHFAQSIPPA
ncbi:FAD-binding oxidoreductase [Tengunoibacter tsumagoiensis]|uniref:FAD-binding dehydrogenase n=1 Tax=Tengunoibacter tsumagoiensis TaxID=2014871 RepID=A0A402A382_9CHLR|nr:FAD-binding oxidoreductase [Tengunoibacter tsumagoiensis]GCE13532.1 FAD-binding dehydrogenase [Tengunoibacter tsumagoiensis]